MKAEATPIDARRVAGNCLCEICGKEYQDHRMDQLELSFDGQPFLHLLCDGERVKL